MEKKTYNFPIERQNKKRSKGERARLNEAIKEQQTWQWVTTKSTKKHKYISSQWWMDNNW